MRSVFTDLHHYKCVTNYLHSRFIDLGLNCPKPAGSFYLFPDFEKFKTKLHKRGIITSGAMANALLEESGVAVLPGSDFYMPATNLGARVAAVDFDGARVLNTWPGADQITEEYTDTYLPNIKQGCEWIERYLSNLD